MCRRLRDLSYLTYFFVCKIVLVLIKIKILLVDLYFFTINMVLTTVTLLDLGDTTPSLLQPSFFRRVATVLLQVGLGTLRHRSVCVYPSLLPPLSVVIVSRFICRSGFRLIQCPYRVPSRPTSNRRLFRLVLG